MYLLPDKEPCSDFVMIFFLLKFRKKYLSLIISKTHSFMNYTQMHTTGVDVCRFSLIYYSFKYVQLYLTVACLGHVISDNGFWSIILSHVT